MFEPRELHPLLARRFSPTTFDAAHELPDADVALLLEAARWAPSAGNSQPWAFIVGRRGDRDHRRLVGHLAASSARWAPSASVLLANLSHRFVEGTDWAYSEFAHYDLGQAVAHLTVQAHALGLHVRQFRAFDRAGLAAEFGIPAHWEVTTMAAVGRIPRGAAPDPTAPPEGTAAPEPTPAPEVPPGSIAVRERRAPDDLLWPAAGVVS